MWEKDVHLLSGAEAKLISDITRNEEKQTVTLGELALDGIVRSICSIPNSITYLNEKMDYSSAVEEYSGLLEFIKKSSEPEKSQLTDLLYPMYVNIYLSLLREGNIIEAQKFYSLHCKLFLNGDGYADVVNKLAQLKTTKDVYEDPYFKQFWDEKYIVKLSDDSLERLKSYLKEIKSRILLPLLHLQFFIEGRNEFKHFFPEDGSTKEEMNMQFTNYVEKQNSTRDQTKKEKISELKSIIETVTDGPLSVPVSYKYIVETDKENICAIDVNPSGTLFSCGFEDSSIHTWSLTSDLLISEVDPDDSQIDLAFTELKLAKNSKEKARRAPLGRSKRILRGHNGPVFSLVYTPYHDVLLSCSADMTVRAWSMKTFKTKAVYHGNTCILWDIDVSSDTSYFATAGKDCTAKLFAFDRFTPLRVFTGHTSDVDCVKFHSNGNYIATASADKTIRLWTTQDARCVRYFLGHESYISSIIFSQDGKYLASADDGGCIKIWDLGSGVPVKDLHGHTKRVLSMCFSKNDSILASGGFDKLLRLWDVRSSSTAPEEKRSSGCSSEMFHECELNGVLHFVRFETKGFLRAIVSPNR